ncbi:MAG: efflux RND transporter periplasmic adaptor subunit [Caldilineales bacterium]|nr:efflux RND transporter periplasmic adaptor subunit [Caldilineales bacterium]
MKKFLRPLLIVLVLAVVAAGGYWFYENRNVSSADAGETYTQVVEVRQGALNATVSVVGQLEAQQSATLAFEHMNGASAIESLSVQAGAVVTAGQTLATIDPAPYQQALDQAKSDLQTAEDTLSDLQTPATALEIAQADVAVAKAQVELQKAQSDLDDLVNPDIPSLQAAVASAQSALATAQANALAQEQDQSSKEELARLVTAEAAPTADYTRLANETYSDDYYQDRLELAYDKMMDAQDARISYELNQQAGALQAQMSLRKAQANLVDAQEALANAQAGGDALTLAQAQLAVHEAEVELQAAQEKRQALDEGASASELAAAQADADKKRLAVSEAEAALTGAQLTAPFAGVILETYVSAGDQVSANTTILELADLDTLQVLASVDETTIRQVSAGQAAIITFDAFPGQSFGGAVLSTPLQGTLQGGVMVYDVPVSLSGAEDLTLLVGMTANVEIQVGQVGETLLVPTVALQQSNGRYQVLAPNAADPDGEPEAVTVEIGLSDGAFTQILSGLEAGDQVLVEITTTEAEAEMPMMGGPGSLDGGAPPAPPSGGGAPPSR